MPSKKKPPQLKLKYPAVVVMSGVPGSGKSTVAKYVLEQFGPDCGRIISTDDFFMNYTSYEYDGSKIGEAHAWCFFQFLTFLEHGPYQLLIVDNTNISPTEISPYLLGAAAHEFNSVILEVDCDVNEAVKRQLHGAKPAAIRSMYRTFEERKLEKYWRVVRWNSNRVVNLSP